MSAATAANDDQEFLTVEEAAVLLRINRTTLYAAISRGEVPGVVRFGRTIRLRRDALLSAAS